MKTAFALLSAAVMGTQAAAPPSPPSRFPPVGPPPSGGFPPLPPFPEEPPVPAVPGWEPGMPSRRRDCTFDTSNPYVVTAVSVRHDENPETIDDVFHFRFSVIGFPSLRMTHFQSENDTLAATSYRVSLFRVAEVDVNNTDPGNSTSYQSLTSNPTEWTPITITETDVENGTLYNLSTTRTYADGMVVRWDTSISSNDALIEEEAWLEPSTVKWSFTVTNYQYQFASPSNLALVGLVSANTTSVINVGNEATIDNGGSLFLGGGKLTWDTWVNADGLAHSLKTEDLDADEADLEEDLTDDDDLSPGEHYKFLGWVIDGDQPYEVFWDPVLTTEDIPASSSDDLSAGAVAGIVIAVVVVLLIGAVVVKKFVIGAAGKGAYHATETYSTADVEVGKHAATEGTALMK